MKRFSSLSCFLFAWLISLAGSNDIGPVAFGSKDYVIALKKVTDVMVNDVTSPVAASRYYAYVTLGAYEVGASFQPSVASMKELLPAFKGIRIDSTKLRQANYSYAVIYSLLRLGEKLLPSGYMLSQQADSLSKIAIKKGVDASTIKNTESFVNDIVQQLLVYIRADHFSKLSGMPRYTPRTEDAYWQPTAPAFMQPVEPYWSTIRTFVIDSASQFRPAAPAPYDTAKGSGFYKMMKEVYTVSRDGSRAEKEIAMFWDCNPFALQQIGHVEFGLKKISPGGHWLGITGIVCLGRKLSFQQTALVHALVSITLADAFISCWEEKFRSNRIRPETCINRLIDPYWRPLLQTPPFPEYPSGHSVISSAVATLLTTLIGDRISFLDDTEVEFGLKKRRFSSFLQASKEAGISRLYGGIHYIDAITYGQIQGQSIGRYILEKLKNTKLLPSGAHKP